MIIKVQEYQDYDNSRLNIANCIVLYQHKIFRSKLNYLSVCLQLNTLSSSSTPRTIIKVFRYHQIAFFLKIASCEPATAPLNSSVTIPAFPTVALINRRISRHLVLYTLVLLSAKYYLAIFLEHIYYNIIISYQQQ